ncbi:MAG: hypothetical protein E7651_08010 [Ruminococcaceae bacterium]|nr:hypothetical protein [Oscillospiraceae bacterium]
MKKTLATILVVALVASVCGMMFVSAEDANLALGKEVLNATLNVANGNYCANMTDGVIADAISSENGVWFGYLYNPDKPENANTAADGVAIPTIDLGEVTDLGSVRMHIVDQADWGICAPTSATAQVSNDGVTFTDVATVSEFQPGVAWVEFDLSGQSAQYVRLAIDLNSTWFFLDEIEIYAAATEGGDEPEAPAETTLSVTHVNLYSWNAYRCQIITGEGNSCASYAHTAFDATEYVVLKVENVDGAYTVTAIEGAGVAKTLTAPADGFLLYCGNKDPDNFAIVGNVKVGDVVLANTVDLATDAASETVIGTITFGSAAEEDGPGDAGILVFAVLAVVAIAGCAVATKIKSSAL